MPDTISWRVGAAEQAAFTELSGDLNPLHTDPLVARRLPFGRVAVHGMHLVMRALDQTLGHVDGAPTAIKATFRRPVGVGDELTTTIECHHPLRVAIDAGRLRVVDLSVTLGDVEPDRRRPIDLPIDDVLEEHSVDSLVGLSRGLPIHGDPLALADRFPVACARLGARSVAELLTWSRVVGMHVPGVHSLFSSFDVRLRPQPRPAPTLEYEVVKVDARFRLVAIDVVGSAWDGRLQAFVRPEPVETRVDTAAVTPGEFAGQRWLVAGGSRGLGAAAAALLTAGRADVRRTYLVGRTDSAWQLDAADPLPGIGRITADGWSPTHLGWFATPPIFADTPRAEFVRVYVDGFTAAVEHLAGSLQGVLWPSSEAVVADVPGLGEYAAAKRLGEQRCAELAHRYGIAFATPRWPRLLTDQTTSFVPVEFGDTTTEILASLRTVASS